MALRIVVLGAGHWHGAFDAAYLRLFARMPAVQVVGVHDDDPAVAADRARIVGATAYTDARQLIERERPDFALSLGTHATMPSLHRLCLDHHLPFMTEKPMGRHADEVRPVVERIEREDLYVAVALPNRLGPIYARAKAMLAEGAFGTPVYLHFRIIRPTLNRYPEYDSPWMLDPAISGGGCLRNLGPHPFDVFLSLTGEAAEVTAATWADPQVELAPRTWTMRFWADPSIPMTAMPEVWPSATATPDTSTPAFRRPSSNWGPKMSSPTCPTMAVRPPMRAAATAWLAPLPPA